MRAHASRILLEASGTIRLDTGRAIAGTGVDLISVGALTRSAPALGLAMGRKNFSTASCPCLEHAQRPGHRAAPSRSPVGRGRARGRSRHRGGCRDPRAGRQRIQVPHRCAVSTEVSCKRVRAQGSSDAVKGPTASHRRTSETINVTPGTGMTT
ncbi:hypothetical protein [Streptomyces hundungensis]|uniref:hypothetical protein n=1 Tax=Streptomyces hundungensis TaxID=1077946 RepID=UPI0033F8664A